MTVYHWTINGIAACRSPLCAIVSTVCTHANPRSAGVDLLKLRRAWPDLELKLRVVEGSCNQREYGCCHCDPYENYDCGCSDWVDPVDVPPLREEYAKQVDLLNARRDAEAATEAKAKARAARAEMQSAEMQSAVYEALTSGVPLSRIKYLVGLREAWPTSAPVVAASGHVNLIAWIYDEADKAADKKAGR